MQLSKEKFRAILPYFIAFDIAVIALLYYIFSGQGSLNNSTRTLQSTDPKVESVQLTDGDHNDKTASIQCKDGTTYEVYYPPGETNYDALSNSKCPQDQ